MDLLLDTENLLRGFPRPTQSEGQKTRPPEIEEEIERTLHHYFGSSAHRDGVDAAGPVVEALVFELEARVEERVRHIASYGKNADHGVRILQAVIDAHPTFLHRLSQAGSLVARVRELEMRDFNPLWRQLGARPVTHFSVGEEEHAAELLLNAHLAALLSDKRLRPGAVVVGSADNKAVAELDHLQARYPTVVCWMVMPPTARSSLHKFDTREAYPAIKPDRVFLANTLYWAWRQRSRTMTVDERRQLDESSASTPAVLSPEVPTSRHASRVRALLVRIRAIDGERLAEAPFGSGEWDAAIGDETARTIVRERLIDVCTPRDYKKLCSGEMHPHYRQEMVFRAIIADFLQFHPDAADELETVIYSSKRNAFLKNAVATVRMRLAVDDRVT